MNSLLHFPLSKCRVKQTKEKQGTSFAKVMSLLICALCMQASIHAQHIHTYHNADSANPILNASPKPQGIQCLQFFDIDGDKDLDCYVTTSGNDKPLLYINVGTPKRPEYQLSATSGFEDLTLVPSKTKSFGFFDFDNDGDMDFFYEGTHTGAPATNNYEFIKTYRNIGTPGKPHFIADSTGYTVPYATAPHVYIFFTFQDVDGDGDLDYAFSSDFPYQGDNHLTRVYLNTSTSGNAVLTEHYYGTEVLTNPEAFYDFSGDGLPDCLLNSSINVTQYFLNKGTATAPYVDIYRFGGAPPAPDFGSFDVRTVADLNNDGEPEVFNYAGNYETAVPVPVLKATKTHSGGKTTTKLSATTQLPGYKYKWERNGKIVKGNTRPTINATQPGKYVLYVTDTVGTGVSLPYITPAAAATGKELIVSTKPAMQAVTAQVYPNPFVQSVTLKIAGSSTSATRTIRVSDMSGKVWLTQSTSSSTVQLGATLPKGMYLLEVWEKNALVYHTKILKQ